MYDLTHSASKPASFNLTNKEHELALKQLKKKGMPSSYIRNIHLHSKYSKMDVESSDERTEDYLGNVGFTPLANKDKRSRHEKDRGRVEHV